MNSADLIEIKGWHMDFLFLRLCRRLPKTQSVSVTVGSIPTVGKT